MDFLGGKRGQLFAGQAAGQRFQVDRVGTLTEVHSIQGSGLIIQGEEGAIGSPEQCGGVDPFALGQVDEPDLVGLENMEGPCRGRGRFGGLGESDGKDQAPRGTMQKGSHTGNLANAEQVRQGRAHLRVVER